MTDTTVTPVRREVTVSTTPDRAFQVFTSHFDAWWPRGHHIGAADLHEAVIEPQEGGRWFEIDVDGSQCDWGRVLVWEPPARLVLSWQLNGRFEYDPDPARASEVEVSFRPAGEGSTVVTLEHRYIERMVASEDAFKGIDSEGGWGGLLTRFADVVAASS